MTAVPTTVRRSPGEPATADTALLLIDLQRQFTQPDGVFPVAGIDDILERITAFADVARSHGALVVWVQQSMRPQIGLGRASLRYGRTDAHQGDGTALDPRIEVGPEDVELVKLRQSAFYMTDLELMLRRLGVQRVLVAGITTNVCVLATVKDASERDYETVLLGDLTASLPIAESAVGGLSADEVQRAALAFVQYAYGDVRQSDEIVWNA